MYDIRFKKHHRNYYISLSCFAAHSLYNNVFLAVSIMTIRNYLLTFNIMNLFLACVPKNVSNIGPAGPA